MTIHSITIKLHCSKAIQIVLFVYTTIDYIFVAFKKANIFTPILPWSATIFKSFSRLTLARFSRMTSGPLFSVAAL